MANLGGLPNLGSRRLTVLQKQLHSSRKTTAILNDKLKDSLDVLERSVDRQKQSEEFRHNQDALPVKKSLLEKRALRTCLQRRRLSSSVEREGRPRNGLYDGASLRSMKPQVNHILAQMEPTQRRRRNVEQLKSMGYRDGRLVHYEDSLHKFHSVLNRPKLKSKRNAVLAPLGPTPQHGLLKEFPLGMDDVSSLSSLSGDDVSVFDDVTLHRRSASADGARPLPLSDMADIRRQSHCERSLPATSRKTTSKLPAVARRVSAFGPY